jgi:alkaline phosphatase D
MSISNPKIDVEYPDVTTKILTFGSCHNNKLLKPGQPIIWDAISALKPDAFLWTGDTIYSSIKSGISSPALLQEQYAQMTNNKTIGYSTFLSKGEVDGYLKGGVHGTWDDHDYGANDSGMQMPKRKERQNLLLDFWGVDEKDERRERNGIYSSVTFGTAPQKVKVVFMDTRSARSRHCIPSVGALPIPMASAFACVTRWITAGLNLQKFIPRCKNGKILDDAQWTWLEEQMLGTDAQVNILVSSIQVLSSNPMMETWGQFPSERDRLLSILNNVEEGKSVVVLSGDVHHAEILDSSTGVSRSTGRTIEVTSSGLTHR